MEKSHARSLPAPDEFKRALNQLIVGYLGREKYIATANALIKESALDDYRNDRLRGMTLEEILAEFYHGNQQHGDNATTQGGNHSGKQVGGSNNTNHKHIPQHHSPEIAAGSPANSTSRKNSTSAANKPSSSSAFRRSTQKVKRKKRERRILSSSSDSSSSSSLSIDPSLSTTLEEGWSPPASAISVAIPEQASPSPAGRRDELATAKNKPSSVAPTPKSSEQHLRVRGEEVPSPSPVPVGGGSTSRKPSLASTTSQPHSSLNNSSSSEPTTGSAVEIGQPRGKGRVQVQGGAATQTSSRDVGNAASAGANAKRRYEQLEGRTSGRSAKVAKTNHQQSGHPIPTATTTPATMNGDTAAAVTTKPADRIPAPVTSKLRGNAGHANSNSAPIVIIHNRHNPANNVTTPTTAAISNRAAGGYTQPSVNLDNLLGCVNDGGGGGGRAEKSGGSTKRWVGIEEEKRVVSAIPRAASNDGFVNAKPLAGSLSFGRFGMIVKKASDAYEEHKHKQQELAKRQKLRAQHQQPQQVCQPQQNIPPTNLPLYQPDGDYLGNHLHQTAVPTPNHTSIHSLGEVANVFNAQNSGEIGQVQPPSTEVLTQASTMGGAVGSLSEVDLDKLRRLYEEGPIAESIIDKALDIAHGCASTNSPHSSFYSTR